MKNTEIRLSKVLRKLEITLKRAVDFLKLKGIMVEQNPNTRISISELKLLVNEFCNDKAVKLRMISELLESEEDSYSERVLNASVTLNLNEHIKFKIIEQKERSTILLNELSGITYPCKKISKLVNDNVIMQISSLEKLEKPSMKYSAFNDFVEDNEYEFDIVEKLEKGYKIENSEDYTSFIPLSYEKHIIDGKKIYLTIERIDNDKNQLFFKSKEIINRPITFNSSNLVDLTELFAVGEKYSFNVNSIRNLEEEGISIILLEYKEIRCTVKAYSYQNEENLPKTITCIVTFVSANKIYLIQDKFSSFLNLYKEGNKYEFEVISLEHDSNTASKFFIISDKYGFTHKLYNNEFESEEFESLKLGEPTLLYLRRIDEKGHLVLNLTTGTNQGVFISVESIFQSIDKSDSVNKFFYEFEHELKKDIYKELPFSNLFEDYNKRENLWVFSYLSFLNTYIYSSISSKTIEKVIELAELHIKIEEWMLEGSDFLQKFSLEKRPFIIKKAEKQLENIKIIKEALLLIKNNESEIFIQDVLKTLRLSGYLRGNKIKVFKTLVLISNDSVLKKTNEIIEIILLLINSDLLDNYDITKFIELLQYRINIEKYELNPVLLTNKVNLIDSEAIVALENIVKVLGLQIILHNKNLELNKAILKSALLCRYLSVLSSTENEKISLLNKAVFCITTGTSLNIFKDELTIFNLENFSSGILKNSIEPSISNDLKGNQIFKLNGAIYSTQNGWAVFSKQQSKFNTRDKELNINPIISFFDNRICVASTQKNDFKLSYDNDIETSNCNWDSYYKTEFSEQKDNNKNSDNLYIGQRVSVYAKNYLKNNDSIIFLKITEQNYEGEGVLRLKDTFKFLTGFDEIINPGDELNVEITKFDERGILFSLLPILNHKVIEEVNVGDVIDAKVIKIFNNHNYLITENGHFAYFENNNKSHDIEERKVYKFKITEINLGFDYVLTLKFVANSERSFNEKLVIRSFLERKNVLILNSEEYEISDPKNFNLLLLELISCVENIMHLEKENFKKIEYLQLLKLLSSINKNVKSYYFQSLIRYFQDIYLFKKSDYMDSNLKFEPIDEKTLSYFKPLEIINERYKYMNFYNNINSITELINYRNEVTDVDDLKLINMLLAHNLLISDNPDEIILKRTKDLIFEFLSNEKVNTFENLISSIDAELVEVNIVKEDSEEEVLNLGKEGTYREFKTSVVFYAGTNSQDLERQSSIIMKTIAGFLNSKGGSLFIGVNDLGEIIGLKNDYIYFGKLAGSDKFEREIRSIIVKSFNKDVNSHIEFKFLISNNLEYCEIIIPSYDKPVPYYDNFYQRQGNETRVITGNDLIFFFERKLNKSLTNDNSLIFSINKESYPTIMQSSTYQELNNSKQINLFEENIDFYSDQKKENNNLKIDYNIANKSIIAYMYIYINGKYIVSTKKLEILKSAEEIIIYDNFRSGFLLQCYDNGCVNKVEVRTLLDKTLGRLYSNGFSLQGNLIGLFLIQEECLLQVNTVRNNIEYIKIVESEIISTHTHLNLKGNNIVQEDFDLLSGFKIIDKIHKEKLTRITYKSKQSLGIKSDKLSYQNEIEYLSGL